MLHNPLIPATTSVYWPLNTSSGNYFGPWEQRVGAASHLTNTDLQCKNITLAEDFSFIDQTLGKIQSIDLELLTRPAGHSFSKDGDSSVGGCS